MQKKIGITLIMFLIVAKINGQQNKNTTRHANRISQLALYDLKQVVKGVGHAFTRPLSWKKKDYTKLGAFVVGSLALSTIDDEANNLFSRNERHVPNLFIEAGTRFGKPQFYFITNAALYGTGLFTRNEKLRKTSVLIIASSVTTGVIQSFAKTAIGRARPTNTVNGLDSKDFKFWSHEAGFHSFPSGHTVLSVTMAHAVAKQFKNPWSKAGVYSLGAIAPISRLFVGAHWLTDVTAGAFLSIVVVDAIDNFLFKTKAYNYPTREKKISWNFRFTGNQIGVVGHF